MEVGPPVGPPFSPPRQIPPEPPFATYNGDRTFTLVDGSLIGYMKLPGLDPGPPEPPEPQRLQRLGEISHLRLRDDVEHLDDQMFYRYESLISVLMVERLIELPRGAFTDCRLLRTVDGLSDQLTNIHERTFSGCLHLERFVVPRCVVRIGVGAFQDCFSLRTISFPDKLEVIDNSAFCACTVLGTVHPLVIPDSVSSIGRAAFSACLGLETVVLPCSLSNLGNSAFQGCVSLRWVSIPPRLRVVRKNTFRDCRKLETVLLHDNLKFEQGAFKGCTFLEQQSRDAGHESVEGYFEELIVRRRTRYTVLACYDRLLFELYNAPPDRAPDEAPDGPNDRPTKRVRNELTSERATSDPKGATVVFRGKAAFDTITSSDVWRYVIEFI